MLLFLINENVEGNFLRPKEPMLKIHVCKLIQPRPVRSGNSAAINFAASGHSCSNATPTTGSPRVSYSSLSIVPHAGSMK